MEKAQADDPDLTLIIITHRLSSIRSCDTICVLEKGHIVEIGSHSELMERHGKYYRMLNHTSL